MFVGSFPEALGLGHANDLSRVGVEMQGLSRAVGHVTQVAKERADLTNFDF